MSSRYEKAVSLTNSHDADAEANPLKETLKNPPSGVAAIG
jgi:hypothetical protein